MGRDGWSRGGQGWGGMDGVEVGRGGEGWSRGGQGWGGMEWR